jgi:hypothetical protein
MASNTLKEPEEKEVPDVKEKPKKTKGNPVLKGLVSVLDGTILIRKKVVNSLPFLMFLVFLAILYIANTYYSEKKNIEIEKIKKELKELRSENIITKKQLDSLSLQSEIIDLLKTKQILIKESTKQPNKIYVKNDSTKTKK